MKCFGMIVGTVLLLVLSRHGVPQDAAGPSRTGAWEDACFSHPSVELIQQWGFWERSHWRPRAALFREDWTPKPNGRRFLDLVFNRWMTRETGTTGADGRFAVRGFLGEYEVAAEKDGRVARGRCTLPKDGHTVRLVLDTTTAAGSIRLGDQIEAVAVAVASGATPREQLAAQEIVDYLARISGKRLQRQEIADGHVPPGVIAVGRLAKDAGLVSQEELEAAARDGYVLKVAAGRAAVCGGRDLGTLSGVYGLLRQLGVKFYARDCEVVPAIPNLVLPEGTTQVRPRYDLLGFYSLVPFFGLEPNVKLGHTPHDDHGNIRGPHDNDPAGHTSDFLVPYKTYGKEHPEYFALMKDGQRLHPVPGKRFDVHLCLSNPEVRRISTQRLLGLIESQQERTYIPAPTAAGTSHSAASTP